MNSTIQSLPDLLEPGLRAIFCGINPGVCAAERGHHFLGRGNRFWRVLHLAGITPALIDALDDKDLLKYGYGITAVVDRPSSRAAQVAKSEFVDAAGGFRRKMATFQPAHIAFLGKVAFSNLFAQRTVNWGRQAVAMGTSSVWVLPNPSGLNRAFSLADLVEAYKELRIAVNQTSSLCASSARGILGVSPEVLSSLTTRPQTRRSP